MKKDWAQKWELAKRLSDENGFPYKDIVTKEWIYPPKSEQKQGMISMIIELYEQRERAGLYRRPCTCR